jgi:ADP-heptose:LPS heptosyltransferase
VNGVRLVSAALGERVDDDPPMEGRDAASRLPRSALTIPASAIEEAGRLLSRTDARQDGAPLVGLHVGAGRAIKEWPVARMAEIGSWAARELGAALVLTGGRGDQAAAQRLQDALAPAAVINLAGAAGLLPLAAVLSRLVLFVTPDTGPMHLAATVGTPLVAVFGPSSPDRWGPLSRRCAVVRIDLPCSPCNRIRDPPARCLGHTPDCLEGIAAGRVIEAAKSVLRAEGEEDGDGSR